MKTLILVFLSFASFAQVKQKPDTAKQNSEQRKYLAAKARLQAKQDSTFGIKPDTIKKQPLKKQPSDKPKSQ